MPHYLGKCIGITDGDTITILKDSRQIKIRLEGIDAPEHGQDFSARSKELLSALVFGNEVQVQETGKDKYGRTLARISVGGQDVSLQLVRFGLAWHYKEYSRDTALANAELAARAAGLGLWALPNPMAPWDFRHGTAQSPSEQEVTAGTDQEKPSPETVYVTRTGTKYHRDGCRYLAKSRIPMALADAVSGGYAPCSACRPPSADQAPPPKTQETSPPKHPASGEIVYVTRTGSKYHRAGCSSLRKSMIPISKSDAVNRGYGPCSRCRP